MIQNSEPAQGKHLMSLAITPQSPATPLGDSVQFHATAVFSDGSKTDVTSAATWHSGQPKVASINKAGLASSDAVGATFIMAVYETASDTSTLTISSATLVSIAVAPQSASLTPNHFVQLKANGTFTDGTMQDLSQAVLWSSAPAGIVSVSSGGVVTANALGSATITATSNGVSGADTVSVLAPILKSISITPSAASVPLGESQQFSATGMYNDGSTQDLTSSVTWASSNTTILGLNRLGLATAMALGSAAVTATSGTIQSTAQFQVGPPVVTSFAIAPGNSTLAVDGREQLRAMATLSDGSTSDMTTSVSWNSADRGVAEVSSGGLVRGGKPGSTTISVSANSVEGSANVAVKPVMAVSYFANANTPGLADATVRLTNPGVSGGNICAEIYVFDQDQQLSECCGCLLSTDGLQMLSMNIDLTGNPLTGIKSKAGVIKIIPADASSSASCDPTAVKADSYLLGWSSHIQKEGTNASAITESSFQLTPLGDSELAALQSQCSSAAALGSGQGVCTCGAVGSVVANKK